MRSCVVAYLLTLIKTFLVGRSEILSLWFLFKGDYSRKKFSDVIPDKGGDKTTKRRYWKLAFSGTKEIHGRNPSENGRVKINSTFTMRNMKYK